MIPGSGRSPGDRNGNPLQYPCLENAMDRGAWWATVRGLTKSQTRLTLSLSTLSLVVQWLRLPNAPTAGCVVSIPGGSTCPVVPPKTKSQIRPLPDLTPSKPRGSQTPPRKAPPTAAGPAHSLPDTLRLFFSSLVPPSHGRAFALAIPPAWSTLPVDTSHTYLSKCHFP